MADVKATALSPTQAFDPATDYLMAVRGDADGARSGPHLVPGLSVSVGSAASGGGGDTGTPVTGGITKVFGRTGPEISAAVSVVACSALWGRRSSLDPAAWLSANNGDR